MSNDELACCVFTMVRNMRDAEYHFLRRVKVPQNCLL
jgi:hypothetical protein